MRFKLVLVLSFCRLVDFAQPTVVEKDVCIYGGTSAGVIAAVTAAKADKSAIIVEPTQHIGGMSSGGLGQTDIGNKFAITGLSREFYQRVGQHYGKKEQWTFEPHVAKNIFQDYIHENNIPVLFSNLLVKVNKKKKGITSIELLDLQTGSKTVIKAKMFIDCTYEGDLMAKAGVRYTVGREASSIHGESWNGVQLLDKHQFPDGIDPYQTPAKPESGLLWGISPEKLQPKGSGDKKIQAYNFRLCLTNDSSNRIPIVRPGGYDAAKYELLIRQLSAYTPDSLNWQLMHFAMMPNHKTDINNCGGFSTDMIGANYDYPEADFQTRQNIIKEHEGYTKGLLYFIGNDLRVPEHLRKEMRQWGYPKDEYLDNDHFTPQLYVRETRRMVSQYVMTQQNCQGKRLVEDGIGYAAYTMDSHNCQRIVVNGMVKNEGDVQVGGFPPYPVSFRSIVPREKECTNLLVPVCLSASHIAYGSIRMEPVFMVLSQSAAMAAVLAIDRNIPIQKVDAAQIRALTKIK